MTIESQIERIAVALEKFVALAEGRTVVPPAGTALEGETAPPESKPRRGRPPGKKEEPKKDEDDSFLADETPTDEPAVTKEDVIKALQEYASREGIGMKTARALLAKAGGSDSIGKVPPEKYADVIKAIPAK